MPFSDLPSAAILDALPDAAVILEPTGRILHANTAFVRMLGIERPEAEGKDITLFLKNPDTFSTCVAQMERSGICEEHEALFLQTDGQAVRVFESFRPLGNGSSAILAVLRTFSRLENRTEALERANIAASEELSSTKMQLEELLSMIREIIWYIDDKTMKVRYVSRAVESVFGLSRQAFLDQPDLWQRMVCKDDRIRVQRFFEQIQTDGGQQSIDFRIQRSDGEIRWLNNRISYHAHLHLFIGITHDVTDSKSSKDLVEFLAYHDPLTQLPNRIYLKEAIENMIGHGKTDGLHFALLFLDLDNFKYINDAMGHEVGDDILVQIARRMSGAVSDKAEIIRFGGDEFIVLLAGIRDRSDIERCGDTLLQCFKEAFFIRDEGFFLSASIGIALYPDDADTPSDLIKRSDTAMYAAKRSGKNRYQFYRREMDRVLQEFLQIEQRIREGIKEGFFRLRYQPFVDAETLKLKGFEALLRYEHPEGVSLSPAQFIPVAERTGDILKLSEFVFRHSCAFSRRIMEVTDTWLPISINLSARQFQDNKLLSTLSRCLRSRQIPAQALALEVTESIVMRDIDTVRTQLETLRQAGFKIALDDFGTGYSSLEYLAKLPIDILKIDKSFIHSLFENQQNRHLVRAIATMADVMGMEVTAEGVENTDQADFLRREGVKTLQGYLFSPALGADEIVEKLSENTLYFTPPDTLEFSI